MRIRQGGSTLLVLLLGAVGQAATIQYPDLIGQHVDYVNISEDTREEPNALFGPPDIVGDTMDFDPLSFSSEVSTDAVGSASAITDGQLNFTILAKDGFDLSRVMIREAGDFNLAGLGNAEATVSVFTSVRWTINAVNGADLPNPLNGADELTFTPSNAFSLPNSGGSWEGALEVGVAEFLQSQNVSGVATEVEFVIDNALTAAAASGGSAFVAKKDFSGLTITVPEPCSVAMLWLGFALGGTGLRKMENSSRHRRLAVKPYCYQISAAARLSRDDLSGGHSHSTSGRKSVGGDEASD